MLKIADIAIKYLKRGYSVIPIKPGIEKKPLIDWQQFQKRRATPAEVTAWWKRWPNANIAIVTGRISKLFVVDADSVDALEFLLQHLPKDLETPQVRTPRGGWHFWFTYPDNVELRNTTSSIFPKLDTRGEGGYVLVPPSIINNKKYTWIISLKHSKPTSIPPNLLSIMLQHSNTSYSIYSNTSTNTTSYSSTNRYRENNNINICNNNINNNIHNNSKNHANSDLNAVGNMRKQHGNSAQRLTAGDNKIPEGQRDNVLFHVAHHLVKGRMPIEEIQEILMLIALHGCNPPFSAKEAMRKVESALKRTERRTRAWLEEVRQLVLATSGIITTTTAHQWLQVTTREEKKIVNECLRRLEKEGLVKRTGRKAGEYRIINQNINFVDWKSKKLEIVDFWLPLNMHQAIDILPGSVILLAGMQNAGKTAWAMNIAYQNQAKFKTIYFSSEITPEEFAERVRLGGKPEEWEVKFAEDFDMASIEDYIDPDGLNVLDYLEPPNADYTLMAQKLSDIHRKLERGVAVVCIQKKAEGYGAGGEYMKNKPHLYVTLDVIYEKSYCEAKIVKCKKPKYGFKNPQGLKAVYTIDVKNGLQIQEITPFKFSTWR